MPSREVRAVRAVGPFAKRSRWYRNLVQAIVSARPPAGAVLETSSTFPLPVVTVRPAGLLDSFPESASADVFAPTSVPPAPNPTRPGTGLLGLLWPVPTDPEKYDRYGSPSEDASLAPFVGEGGWVGIQSFWLHRGSGEIEVATRVRVVARNPEARDCLGNAVAARLLSDWTRATGAKARVVWRRPWSLRAWKKGSVRSIPPGAWSLPGSDTYRTAELALREFRPPAPLTGAHTVVFGASGTGKTTYLADQAARAIAAGQAVVVLDVHGDLAPRVQSLLTDRERTRVLAVDASEPPVPGIAGLVSGGASVDRAAAHFVAAVKRLSPDGTELAWGFRLERIFDTFTRLVLETGGSLLDLYAMLTDPERRDAARLATRRPTTARFLDELGPILRRDPEFLWSAATRLSKIVLVPALVDLLAPRDGGLDVEGWLAARRALLLRLPLAMLGPESSAFAATLVLGRLYLGMAARSETHPEGPPVLFVLDEVQGLSPRLVAELLAEGRKFGVEAIVATQYPERLAPEVRSAAAGAAAAFVSFRVPPASSASVAPWFALAPARAAALLPGLPIGVGVTLDPERGDLTWVRPSVGAPPDSRSTWRRGVEATRREFGTESEEAVPPEESACERILLAVLAADDGHRRVRTSELVAAAAGLPGDPITPERLELAWRSLARGPEVEGTPTGLRLTPAGERRLGLGRPTGAARESAEHRNLLLRAFRVFARRGYALEILRQGRFDTTLPDAIFRQLGRGSGPESPGQLAARLDRIRTGWAWRFFGGRDVHVEAEVSGALRAERIQHGWTKAAARGAFALFVVGDAARARRVRRTLRTLGLRPDRAQVWTLAPPGEDPTPNS